MVAFITTCMVSMVAILVWRMPVYFVLPLFLIFAALDGVFMTAVLIKVPEGAWFTLVLAFILASIFIIWRFGKEVQWSAEARDPLKPSVLFFNAKSSGVDPALALGATFGSTPISVVPGLGIFFDKTGDTSLLPASFSHFIRKFAARQTVLVFFHMRPLSVPHVNSDEQYVVRRFTTIPNCYSVVLRHGYADDLIRPGMAKQLVSPIELTLSKMVDPSSTELKTLREASGGQIVYILGKETMKVKSPDNFSVPAYFRRLLLETFLWIRENSRTKLADMNINADQLIEVGFLTEI